MVSIMSRRLQFVRFVLVGGIGLLINLAVTHGLVMMVHVWYLWAFWVGLVVSWSVSFLLNARITFPEHERNNYHKKYAIYIAIYLVVFILNTAIVYALTSLGHVHYLISIPLSAVITTAFSFTTVKRYVYR